MPLRDAIWADLLPASKILAAAFKNEPLFGDFIHPYQDRYPDDMYLFFLRALRLDFYRGPDHRLIVTYKVNDSNEEEGITGFAHWIRKRSKKSGLSVYNQTMIKAVETYNYLESTVYPNRAVEPSRNDILERTDPFIDHHWTGTRANVWYLSLIGVDPGAERRGYGRELVTYGFDRAKEEGVGCSVISAQGREGFYQTCGFDVVVGEVEDEGGEDNPLKGVPNGVIHFWDNGIKPDGLKKYGEA